MNNYFIKYLFSLFIILFFATSNLFAACPVNIVDVGITEHNISSHEEQHYQFEPTSDGTYSIGFVTVGDKNNPPNINFIAGSACDTNNFADFSNADNGFFDGNFTKNNPIYFRAEGRNQPASYVLVINFIADLIARDDAYITPKCTALCTTLENNVLINDTTTNTDMNVTAFSSTTDGNFSINSDGSFTYTPAITTLSGIYSFDYNVTDDMNNTDTATISINVVDDMPVFCYGYRYKQNDIYFTEDNNGTQTPRITGNTDADANISVSVYISNTTTVEVPNLSLIISDMDGTQATYPDQTIYNKYTSTGLGDYFFINYDLIPADINIDIPLGIDLEISGFTQTLGSNEIEMCSPSDSSFYMTQSGKFNVVDNDYYNATTQYYNIPTQVTSREGNFKVISLNDSGILSGVSTFVAVDIVDVGNDSIADCQDPEGSRISTGKIWIWFNDETNADLNSTEEFFTKAAIEAAIALGDADELPSGSNSSDFYKKASKNAAFRVSYFPLNDEDGLLRITDGKRPNTYDINFPDLSKLYPDGCANPVTMPNGQVTSQIPVACSNNGGMLTREDIRICQECLYGRDTVYVCSKDNFAIRPEAFLINFNDTNESIGSSTSLIPASGVTHNVAAGYQYNLEVNATNHQNDTPSNGYSPDPYATDYIWSNLPNPSCNDEGPQSTIVTFLNGIAEDNTTVDQVGDYNLNIIDTTWCDVDENPTRIISPEFLTAPDCIPGDNVVKSNDPYPLVSVLNGCEISSNHTNINPSFTGANAVYTDYNVTFHPYKFDMTGIVPSHGENNNTIFTTTTFIYMSDMEQDEEMSFHLNGNIRASGKNDANLSNFVNGCYAKPITLTINKSAISRAIAYKSRFTSFEANASVILTTNVDMNNTVGNINLNTANFTMDLNGSIITTHNLNFDRNLTIVMNPEELTFSSYDANCTNPAVDCTFSADLTTKTTQGSLDLNQTIKHYYGRTHTARQRYTVPLDAPYRANIHYEIYCFGTIGTAPNTNTCVPATPLLPSLTRTDDIRWYVNTEHNISNDGNVNFVIQQGSNNPADDDIVDSTNPTSTVPTTVDLNYDGSQGYPYKTTMEINSSRWLIYNADNPNATRNQFQVEFDTTGGWSGEHETDTTTKTDGAVKTNRRSMW